MKYLFLSFQIFLDIHPAPTPTFQILDLREIIELIFANFYW